MLQFGRSGHYCTVCRSQLGTRLQQSSQPRSDHLITEARPLIDKGGIQRQQKISPNGKSLRFTSADRCTCATNTEASRGAGSMAWNLNPAFGGWGGCRTETTAGTAWGWEWRHNLDMIFLQNQISNSVSYCTLRMYMYIAVAHAQAKANHNRLSYFSYLHTSHSPLIIHHISHHAQPSPSKTQQSCAPWAPA
jgi:hypothetical protein